jgi:hypothetical protein
MVKGRGRFESGRGAGTGCEGVWVREGLLKDE